MKDVSFDRDFDYPVSCFGEFRVGGLKIIGHGVYLSGVRQPFTSLRVHDSQAVNSRFHHGVRNGVLLGWSGWW
jgi:hypothetical protein